ncbi:MAG: hypothetical protein PHF66_14250 [Desulfobacteraceae bacterium]|nr:hypothetical protein [Desulfobacteraceae bacterium]
MNPDPSTHAIADLLRRLPAAEPPRDLSRRIMAALPRHRGIPGHLAHAAARALCARSSRNLWLPSNPSELGLFILSIGLFFCCLTAILWLRLPFAHRFDMFLPALGAGLLLVGNGWRQIHSPRTTTMLRPGLMSAGVIFATNVILGLSYGIHSGPGLIATWLGLSGILAAGGLAVFTAPPRNSPSP